MYIDFARWFDRRIEFFESIHLFDENVAMLLESHDPNKTKQQQK